MAMPVGLTPNLIGKVVTVQIFARVFDREEPDSDKVDRDSLENYVGTLQSYYHREDAFAFSLAGNLEPRAIVYKHHRIVIHPYVEPEKNYVFG